MWLWHLYAMLTLYADIPRDGLTVSLWIYILSLLCLFVEYKRDVTWHLFATESTLYATFTQGVKTVGTLWSLWMRPHQSLTVWVPFDNICRIHHCTQALQREILFWHFNTTCIQRKYSLMKCVLVDRGKPQRVIPLHFDLTLSLDEEEVCELHELQYDTITSLSFLIDWYSVWYLFLLDGEGF